MSKPADSFWLWLLQVLVLSLLLVFFLWLSLRPSSPSYAIVDFSLNSTESSVSFSLDFSNDNKAGKVYYGSINVTAYSGSNTIGSTALPAFDQRHERGTLIAGNLVGVGRAWDMATAAVRKRTADLRMGLAVTVRYKIWWWRSKVHWVAVEAGVPVDSGGKMSAKKNKIKMHKAQKKIRRLK